ncbi:uncharacterized protein DDB_G0280205 [Ceratitis capitata]|uniref:uncharacterized protein DDB_G0280205 n=1 Tax=Ceratitis capitata TaxID=7213 RepID=UPI000329B620|nr:uncharacterized protein DDB_G0280205 [Ceratitis capitata]
MLLHRLHAVIWFLSGVIGLYAYPTINIPFLFGTSAYGEGAHRFKKSGLEIQSDADVVELEHLRDHYGNENPDGTDQMPAQFEQPPFGPDIGVGKTVSAEPLSESQELERQLEQMPAITTKLEKIATTTTELAPAPAVAVPENRGDQQSVVEGGGMHRPPTLQHDNGGKTLAEGGGSAGQQQAAEFGAIVPAGGSPPAPSAIKPFYGAARLAFGQNPEVLPTTTTTTTTKASTAVTSTSTTSVMPITTTTTTTTISNTNTQSASVQSAGAGKDTNVGESDILPLDVETVITNGQESTPTNPSDKLIEQIKSTAQRRSVPIKPQQTVESILKRHNGQLTPFDMAQYVFWTGDEAGVARAVEELIDRGVMSRENALAFLREVRIGIEYLQQSYTNRIFPEAGLNINIDKKMFDSPQSKPIAPSTAASINEKSLLPYLRLMQANKQSAIKPVENISVWHKLQALGNDDLNDYDENGERAKISQFLYNEYTLEDILYKLAKIMFTQSLAHGSDEAQHELQKLTDFLEREGNLGVIPTDLQKKVLHILFRALSDTLAERPELLSVANVNLANTYNRLPLRTLDP